MTPFPKHFVATISECLSVFERVKNIVSDPIKDLKVVQLNELQKVLNNLHFLFTCQLPLTLLLIVHSSDINGQTGMHNQRNKPRDSDNDYQCIGN